jgi:hypothetical protein
MECLGWTVTELGTIDAGCGPCASHFTTFLVAHQIFSFVAHLNGRIIPGFFSSREEYKVTHRHFSYVLACVRILVNIANSYWEGRGLLTRSNMTANPLSHTSLTGSWLRDHWNSHSSPQTPRRKICTHRRTPNHSGESRRFECLR